MYSLNKRLWVQPKTLPTFGHFSRYCLHYKLDDRYVLLVNGLTGAIDIVDAQDYSLLAENPATYSARHPATSTSLAERGYLFAGAEDEIRLRASLIDAITARLSERDAIFMLCPTDFCPMGCSYCFAKGRPGKAERRAMSNRDVDAAFDTVAELQNRFSRHVGTVVLYGGEPFQDFTASVLAHIFDRAQNRGLKVAAFSNGFAIPRFRDLLRAYSAHVYVISVTLDGIGSKHDSFRLLNGSFERAVESIDTLIELRVPVQVKMNLNKRNITDIPAVVDFYRAKGWWDAADVFFELSPIQYQGLAEPRDTTTNIELALDFMDLLRKQPELARLDFLPLVDNKYHLIDGLGIHPFPPEKVPLYSAVPRIHNCPSYSKHMFVFGADGRFYLCNEEVGEEHACFGACGSDRPLELDRMAHYFTRDVTALDGCNACAYAMFCGGGCGHHAGAQDRHFCGTLQADFTEIVRRYRDHILAQAVGQES